MTQIIAAAFGEPAMPEEEFLRAQFYGLLARALAASPDRALLEAMARLTGDETEFGRAIVSLAHAADAATVEDAAREYHDLFIGLVRGELVPFASFYLTGFLHERPLAALRQTLGALGIGRAEGVKEPEDHIAALLEVMAGLIAGVYGAPQPLAVQRSFFETHLAPWAPRFFADLEQAKSAALYALVGRLGRIFMAIEAEAFSMADA